ncbi:FKBP-type peptidyl-prolyl cis-trans isomerase [Pedobacter frigoris]|uniref:FKBP-type peptidyl-prolyl cis-trans isomerase n=1 Tax=Pedobacter frigoris TaxID=2571272 RepID=UPI00292F3752|nr:FKBP-type peptidyl-prolyl cis-trans isomerase [Pedobacter frigoris]
MMKYNIIKAYTGLDSVSLRFLAMTWIGLMMVYSLPGYSQLKDGFDIEGDVKGLKTGSELCMVIKRNDRIDTIAKAVATKGIFRFKNVKLPVYPELYLVCVQTEFVENLQLFLDQARDLKITGDLVRWPNVLVSGSKTHQEYLTAKKIMEKVWKEGFLVKYPSGMAPPDSGMAYSLKTRLAVVKQMPDSYYIPAMIATWKHPAEDSGFGKIDIEVKKSFYDKLSDAQRNTYYGKLLGKLIVDDAEYKKWKTALRKSSEGLSSISKEDAAGELLTNAGKNVAVSTLLAGSTSLSKDELTARSKDATLIINMAFLYPGVNGIQSNPTTGYVIDDSGICVTNYHVLKEYSGKQIYQSLSVMTAEGKVYPVTSVLSSSESDDLVIFKVDPKGDNLKSLPLGNAAAEKTTVHVMGHPDGSFYQFTSGVVAENTTSNHGGKQVNIMGITADFKVGSSGGPIVDDCGNVVGTVSRINGGMKVGVPVSELRKLLNIRKPDGQLERKAKAAENKAGGERFLLENKRKSDVVCLASGLQYQVLKTGTGTKPRLDQKVVVNCEGTLIDGLKFLDSSMNGEKPLTVTVGHVIKGWTEALLLMHVGSKWRIFIPSELGYGENGTKGQIGPNSVLIFEIELLGIDG